MCESKGNAGKHSSDVYITPQRRPQRTFIYNKLSAHCGQLLPTLKLT